MADAGQGGWFEYGSKRHVCQLGIYFLHMVEKLPRTRLLTTIALREENCYQVSLRGPGDCSVAFEAREGGIAALIGYRARKGLGMALVDLDIALQRACPD